MLPGTGRSVKRRWRRWSLAAAISAFALAVPGAFQVRAQVGTTILPTDVEPLPGKQNRAPFTNTLQLRLWQRLPSSLFFNGSVENTFRIETNPYQFPLKRTLLHESLPPGTSFNTLSTQDQLQLLTDLSQVSSFDNVHRITPVGTIGWAATPTTQLFVNSFLIRDTLLRNYTLSSTTGALGAGVQQTINLPRNNSLQVQAMARELWQSQQVPVLDYLPSLTWQYNVTNNFSVYANALLQVRFAHFVASYMRELDPFYTWGCAYQRGGWTFLASSTLNQNFRQPFHSQAIIPQNNYMVVCDFEIDRPLISRMPGLVAVFRAEPVYNFHSHATPGLAGMDFRFYYGVRLQAAKPPLNQAIQQLRKRYSGSRGEPVSSAGVNSGGRGCLHTSRQTSSEPPLTVAYSYLTVHGALPEPSSLAGLPERQHDGGGLEDVAYQRLIRFAF